MKQELYLLFRGAEGVGKNEENIIKSMTIEEHKAITEKYIVPDKMYNVIVGDAEKQLKPFERIGFGKPVLIKP